MVRRICGIDEAGRGPLAGPIVAAAVVIPDDFSVDKLEAVDSKRLSEKQREAWAENFKLTAKERGLEFKIEQIPVTEINELGIGWANREIFRRLILAIDADAYIVDGNHKIPDLGDKEARYQSVKHADKTLPLVAAASILAKTYRDGIMRDLHERYPVYNWLKNKGYGTQEHIQAIRQYDKCEHHRNIYVDTVKSKEYASPLTIFLARLYQSILPF